MGVAVDADWLIVFSVKLKRAPLCFAITNVLSGSLRGYRIPQIIHGNEILFSNISKNDYRIELFLSNKVMKGNTLASCDLAIFSTSKKEIQEQKIQKFNKQLTIRSPFGNIERLCNKVFDRFTFGLYTDVCARVSVHVCVRACARACECACVRACVSSLFKSKQNQSGGGNKYTVKSKMLQNENTGRRAVGGQETGRVCDGSRRLIPALFLVHELRVPLRSRDDHVHPDPHGLGRRGHHVIEAVVGLDAEGQRGVGALEDTGQKTRDGKCPVNTELTISMQRVTAALKAPSGL